MILEEWLRNMEYRQKKTKNKKKYKQKKKTKLQEEGMLSPKKIKKPIKESRYDDSWLNPQD